VLDALNARRVMPGVMPPIVVSHMQSILRLLLLSLVILPSSSFAQRDAKKIADVREISCDNTKGYLDYLDGELHKDPTAKAYIIFYGGRSYVNIIYGGRRRYLSKRLLPKRGEAEARVSFWKPYLMNTRNVEASRIEVICGGYRDRPVVELWIVPSGASAPKPTPTVTEKEIKFRRGNPKSLDMFGEDTCSIAKGGITKPCS